MADANIVVQISNTIDNLLKVVSTNRLTELAGVLDEIKDFPVICKLEKVVSYQFLWLVVAII